MELSTVSLLSLAEHSYCASLSRTGPPDERINNDIIFSELSHPGSPMPVENLCISNANGSLSSELSMTMSSTRRGIEGVDFDGFHYPIPLSNDTLELEGLWNGLDAVDSSIINMNTVEVADINTNTSKAELANLEVESNNKESVFVSVGEVVNNTKSRDLPVLNQVTMSHRKSKYSRPRRRTLITNEKNRNEYFRDKFEKLNMRLRRAMSRTGCEGVLSAYFEGKTFSSNDPPLLTTSLPTDPGLMLQINVDANQLDNDDHRYAATVLTHKVSSPPVVKDHSYNEELVVLSCDSAEGEIKSSSGNSRYECDTRKRKRPQPYDYIHSQPVRDQAFFKFAKSMYLEKSLIADRSGATVNLTLHYEGCKFDEENHLQMYKVLHSARKPVKVNSRIIAPKQVNTPLTIYIPNHGPVSIPIQCVLPTSFISSCDALMTPSLNPGIVRNSKSLSAKDLQLLVHSVNGRNNHSTEGIDCRTQPNNGAEVPVESNILNSLETIEPASSPGMETITTLTCSPSSSCNNSSHYSNIVFQAEEIMSLNGIGNSSEPEQTTVPKEYKTSSTNTEPICSICQNQRPSNGNSSVFWIRCNDPFCYEIVHPSCVGFMVTCASHLKQLPAFYCKIHR